MRAIGGGARTTTALIEMLEGRRMLTAYTSSGTSGADGWYIRASGTSFEVWSPIPSNWGSPGTSLGVYSSVSIHAGQGDDTVICDGRYGGFSGGITFAGEDGDDWLQLLGSNGDEGYFYTDDGSSFPNNPDSLSLFAGGGGGAFTDAELLGLDTGGSTSMGDLIEAYGDPENVERKLVVVNDVGPYSTFIVDGVPVRFDVSQHNASILSSVPYAIARAGGNVLLRTTLPGDMAGTLLDLNDNKLVLDYSGASPAADLLSAIVDGRNGGTWNGTNGIKSSVLHDDSTDTHAIGWSEASDALGILGAATATWNGEQVDATTLLARYTWLGDTNLDGTVDTADFTRVRE